MPIPRLRVISVHDCHGERPAFAYTVGAYQSHGLPELFLWATPDEGVDPGEEWVLSDADREVILNDAVAQARRQGLNVGDTWDRDLDGGRSALRVTVVEAEDDLETFEASPDAPVLRLHLNLIRPPAGAPLPLTEIAAAQLNKRTRAWQQALDRPQQQADTTLEQVYGPATDGVDLLHDLLTRMTEDELWVVTTLESASNGATRQAAAEIHALARTSGRAPWLRQAGKHLSQALADKTEDPTVRRHAGNAFCVAAAAWVVVDLISSELFRQGTASIQAAISPAGIPEDQRAIPKPQTAKVRRLVKAPLRAPSAVEEELALFEASWLLVAAGRGKALGKLVPGPQNTVRWQILAAAAVSDLSPGLLRLLPPGHRLAS